MAQEKANYAVTMMARVLEVSRSGFYAWSKRRGTLGTRRARQQDLDEQVRWFHDRSRGTYGAPRITADLHDAGVDVDRKTVARSMKRQGLEGLSTRSFRTPGRKTQAQCRHEDLCERPGITDGSTPPGSRTSLTYAAAKAGCICVRSETGIPVGSSALRWDRGRTRIW